MSRHTRQTLAALSARTALVWAADQTPVWATIRPDLTASTSAW